MGMVLAAMLAERGVPVCVWGPFPAVIEELARTRRSPRMPGLVIDPAVRFEHDGARALADATMVVSAIPTQFVRAAWQPIAAHLASDVPVVSVTKGIEDETLLRPSQVIADAARMAHGERPVAVLSGPTIAAELAMRLPAGGCVRPARRRVDSRRFMACHIWRSKTVSCGLWSLALWRHRFHWWSTIRVCTTTHRSLRASNTSFPKR